MKKILLLTLLCLSCVAAYAAQLTATLQSGDNLTPFYGDNSFVDAYAAATDGDVITLSPGEFSGVGTIAKSLKIIGSYAFDDKASTATIITNTPSITASDVSIEGIRFTGTYVYVKSTDHLTFSRCYISTLVDVKGDSIVYHSNTRLVDCLVKAFGAMEYSDNLVLQNCCIERFLDLNEKSKLAYIENCQIRFWMYNYSSDYRQPYAIYKNCNLGCWSTYSSIVNLSLGSPTEIHDTCLKNYYFYYATKINTDDCNVSDLVYETKECTSTSDTNMPALSFKPYVYNNISYGPEDYKDYPAIPVITSSEIDSKTDAVGNLHVKINAEVRD